jgi:single-strand DNA-binding protein
MSLARIVVSGTIDTQPEKRFTPNNIAVANFFLTVEPLRAGEEPYRVKVTCWRQVAETATEHLQKGDTILVEGRLLLQSFQSPEGVQKKAFEVEATLVEKLAGPSFALPVARADQPAANGAPRQAAQQPQAQTPVAAAAPAAASQETYYESLLTVDDIPF